MVFHVIRAHVGRFVGWWTAAALLLLVVGVVAPPALEVLPWKMLMQVLAIPVAYLVCLNLFRDAGHIKDAPRDFYGGCLLLARAIVFLAVVVGLTVGQ